jgi:chromosome segregation ATPase
MSLAGKILTVLVTLALLAWIYLFASIAQLDKNWGSAIKAQEETFRNQTEALADLRLQVFALDQTILRERAATDDAEATQRRMVEDYHARLFEEREALARVQLHLEAENSLGASSKAAVERRLAERAQFQADLAKLESEVSELEARDAELLTEVNNLNDRFQALLAQNQELAAKRGEPRPSSSLPASSISR